MENFWSEPAARNWSAGVEFLQRGNSSYCSNFVELFAESIFTVMAGNRALRVSRYLLVIAAHWSSKELHDCFLFLFSMNFWFFCVVSACFRWCYCGLRLWAFTNSGAYGSDLGFFSSVIVLMLAILSFWATLLFSLRAWSIISSFILRAFFWINCILMHFSFLISLRVRNAILLLRSLIWFLFSLFESTRGD